MKRNRKTVVGFASTLLLTLSIIATGCSSSKPSSEAATGNSTQTNAAPKQVTTLSVLMNTEWDTPGWRAVMEDLETKTDQLGFKLEVEKFPGKDAATIYRTRFATGNIPDILIYNGALAAQVDLKAELADISGDWTKNFDPNLLKGSTYTPEDKLVGAPVGGTNLNLVFYNKKVFEKLGLQIPNNWTEMLAISEKIRAAGIDPMFLSGKDAWTLQLFAFSGVHREAKGGSTADVMKQIIDRQLKWTDMKLFIDSMQKLVDYKNKGFTNKTVMSDDYSMAQKAIANGTSAMFVMGGFVMDEFIKNYPDQAADIGAFPLNFDDNTNKVGVFVPPAVMVPTNGGKKNVEAAKAFINYFESPETQTIYFKANPGIPAIKGLQGIEMLPAQQDAYNILQTDRVEENWQSSTGPYQYGDLSVFMQEILVGGKTPEQVALAMQDAWDKDAKAKGYPGY